MKGSQGDTISSNWVDTEYADINWPLGNAPFWYGDGSEGTLLDDMQNNYSTLYLRGTFIATDIHLLSSIQFTIDYDDGFILWINGGEVLRQNAPLLPGFDAFAPVNHESGVAEFFEIDADEINLLEGENLIAIQGFNISLGSSDFHLNVAMSAEREIPVFPDSLGTVSFSQQSGYYDAAFNLQMNLDDESLNAYYTLDGSHPGYSATAVKINDGILIPINPASTSGGGRTPGVVVRTSVVEDGYKPSYPQSRTYIFPEAVMDQSHPGGIWPTGDVNGQWLDFEMDTDITRGSLYGNRIKDALMDIPAISVITDLDNLFGASEGIYVNAFGHGPAWERECSVEMIYPDSVAFQTNAGLRIRGGWSRHPNFPKHAFRLFFRSEYGDAKLNYPLFGEEGVSTFDKIDLRTSQNYAWAQGDDRNTMVREVFSRDLQRDMGQPYTRSRYYHLYLNGMYWGLFQTQERSEARFASDYFGDNPEDYDVVKVNTEDWNYRVEATDGNLGEWQEIYDLINLGMTSMSNYYRIQGLDASGNTRRDLKRLVNIDNLVDYMISIFYTGNFDAPTSSFMGNDGCNNFFAIKDRNDPTVGYQFFNHDAEHSMFVDAASPGIGIQEDRVNLGTRTDGMKMEVSDFSRFHPQWLHHKLTYNTEYRTRFMDRAHKYLKPGGVLTEDISLQRFNDRAAQIDKAIIAESARWGDTHRPDAFHRDVHWVRELNDVRNNFFSQRPDIFKEQLLFGALFTTIAAPEVEAENTLVESDITYFTGSIQLRITNPDYSGLIYYTINGQDPRAVGGVPNWRATSVESEVSFDINKTTVVRARVYTNGDWSPLAEYFFMEDDEDYSVLKITEIHYHPLDSIAGTDTISGKSFEFLELKNTGTSAINLSGLKLDSAVRYTFPENAVLLPREFFVIASKPVPFFRRYGKIASGNFQGNLSNGGELILLKDRSGNAVLQFRYDDQIPWPVHADGMGYSIVPTKASPDMDPALADYWVRSAKIGGSPFSNDENSDNTSLKDDITVGMRVYPNPATTFITVDIDDAEVSGSFELQVYDLTGKQVFAAHSSPGERISLESAGLIGGVYIVEVNSGEYHGRTKVLILE